MLGLSSPCSTVSTSGSSHQASGLSSSAYPPPSVSLLVTVTSSYLMSGFGTVYVFFVCPYFRWSSSNYGSGFPCCFGVPCSFSFFSSSVSPCFLTPSSQALFLHLFFFLRSLLLPLLFLPYHLVFFLPLRQFLLWLQLRFLLLRVFFVFFL